VSLRGSGRERLAATGDPLQERLGGVAWVEPSGLPGVAMGAPCGGRVSIVPGRAPLGPHDKTDAGSRTGSTGGLRSLPGIAAGSERKTRRPLSPESAARDLVHLRAGDQSGALTAAGSRLTENPDRPACPGMREFVRGSR
jgi:hypothetical protein